MNIFVRKADEEIAHLKKVIEQLQDEVQNEREECAVLRVGLMAVRHLINESHGVAGLHQNGDIATWEELQIGGRFEEWLASFNESESTFLNHTREYTDDDALEYREQLIEKFEM